MTDSLKKCASCGHLRHIDDKETKCAACLRAEQSFWKQAGLIGIGVIGTLATVALAVLSGGKIKPKA